MGGQTARHLHLLTVEAIYSLNFPWMDQSEHMSKNPMSAMGRAGVLGLFQLRDPSTARRAVDILSIFRGRLGMADGWFRSLARLYKFYMRTKRKLRSHYKITDPFSPAETFKGHLTLLPLRMAKEDYGTLDAAFGAAADDVDMPDAPSEGDRSADAGGVSQLARWNAANAGPNGLASPRHAPSSSSLAPVATAAVQALSAAAASASSASGASPSPVSPVPHAGGGQRAEHGGYGGAVGPESPAPGGGSFSPANASAAAAAHRRREQQQAPQPQQWTAERVQEWVNALETRWTAADVAAFVEGRECNAKGAPGWLGLIWE